MRMMTERTIREREGERERMGKRKFLFLEEWSDPSFLLTTRMAASACDAPEIMLGTKSLTRVR